MASLAQTKCFENAYIIKKCIEYNAWNKTYTSKMHRIQYRIQNALHTLHRIEFIKYNAQTKMDKIQCIKQNTMHNQFQCI